MLWVEAQPTRRLRRLRIQNPGFRGAVESDSGTTSTEAQRKHKRK
jgi:hypothetical protein